MARPALRAQRPRFLARRLVLMPRILYIGQTPAEGTGSPVIVLRHLQRLAASGWQITIVGEGGQDNSACTRAGWRVTHLPLRRPWWPPFRRQSAILRSIRTWLLADECIGLVEDSPPNAILGYLAAHDDFNAEIATRYARRRNIPLTLLVHDDAAAFTDDAGEKARLRRRHAWMLRCAHRCWFVSPELAAVYALPAPARRVLAPIPAGWPAFAPWQPAFAARPRVYYAGFIWPAQLPLLQKIAQTLADADVSLVLLTRPTPELTAFLRNGAVAHIQPFPTNREALAHLAQTAAGIVVSYAAATAQMPWIATSFPSKLAEQTQLGLPCAIVAPADSAVGRWARRVGYADFIAPAELTRLGDWARDLRAESTWLRRAETARRLASSEFNPEKIQADFTASLLRA